MDDIETRLRAIVVKKLSVEESKVTKDARIIGDLGADSLDLCDLVMDFEEATGVDVNDETIEEINTFGDAVRIFSERAAAPRAARGGYQLGRM